MSDSEFRVNTRTTINAAASAASRAVKNTAIRSSLERQVVDLELAVEQQVFFLDAVLDSLEKNGHPERRQDLASMISRIRAELASVKRSVGAGEEKAKITSQLVDEVARRTPGFLDYRDHPDLEGACKNALEANKDITWTLYSGRSPADRHR